MVFQILLTERARTRAGVGGGGSGSGRGWGVRWWRRRRGSEESLRREEAERRELFLSRQAFVSPGPASCSSLPGRRAVTVCNGPPPPHPKTPHPHTPLMHPSSSRLSPGSAVGPLFQGHCGGLSGVAAHALRPSAKWGQSRGSQSLIHIS